MLKAIPFLLVLATAAFAQDSANEEAPVWNLEKAYWEYVKANDLEKYRALWHENFLGWPFVSSAPVRKDHITDWITSNTSKGVKLQSYSIEQLAITQRYRDLFGSSAPSLKEKASVHRHRCDTHWCQRYCR